MGVPRLLNMTTTDSTQPSDKFDVDDAKVEQVHIEGVSETVSFTAEEEKKLVRKIDLFLLPTIWLMYLLSYIDRTK